MSCDDGCASDVRVAELAKKYKVPCVFYWPVEWHSLAYDKGYKPLTYKEAVNIAMDFEIGGHTISHRHLTRIDTDDVMNEVVDCKFMLEQLFPESEVTKFCPPRGYTNEHITAGTLSLYESQRLTKGPGLVHVHPDSGANENMPWQKYASIQAELMWEEPIELWFHSWELDKYNLWEELETFLKANTK